MFYFIFGEIKRFIQNFEQNILNLKLAKNLSKFSRDDKIDMSI